LKKKSSFSLHVNFNGEGTRVGVAGRQQKRKERILLVRVARRSGGTATASSAIQQIKLIAYLSRRHIEQRTSDIERQQINRPTPIDGGASAGHFHSSSSSSIVSGIFLSSHMINSLSSARIEV
jgi:hypothetical protein